METKLIQFNDFSFVHLNFNHKVNRVLLHINIDKPGRPLLLLFFNKCVGHGGISIPLAEMRSQAVQLKCWCMSVFVWCTEINSVTKANQDDMHILIDTLKQ